MPEGKTSGKEKEMPEEKTTSKEKIMPDEKITSKEVQLLIFSLGNEEFGARTDQVKEIIKMTAITRMPKAASFIQGSINLRGKVIAVIDLAKQLDLPQYERSEEALIMVVDMDDNIVGMVIDSASEVLSISTENIDPTPGFIESRIDTTFIEGLGKLGDRLFVLLDLSKILSSEDVKSVDKVMES